MVMAQLVEGQMCKPGGGFDAMAQQVWTHMVRTAPIARDMARAFRADPEHAYSRASFTTSASSSSSTA